MFSRSFGVIGLALTLTFTALTPVAAQAQNNPIKILEEDIDLLKETIENQNRQIRKLKERLKKAENSETGRQKVIDGLQKRLAGIDVLQKQLQTLEAKLNESAQKADRKAGARMQIFGDLRLRPEMSINRTDLNEATDDADAFWAHRVRLGASLGWDDWVRSKVVLQEARTLGSTITTEGALGLHEGWIELAPTQVPGLRLRGGRMELSYGNERLIGRDDFSFTGRAFDGALIGYGYNPYIDAELLYSKIHEGDGQGDRDLVGLYITTLAIPWSTLELYYFALLEENKTTITVAEESVEQTFENKIHTIGARFETVLWGQLLIDVEAIVQLGTVTDTVDPTKELEHFATAYYAQLGYQAPVLTYPRLNAHFAYATGDANPGDEKSIDFKPLFPSRHTFLGKMDLFSWTNLIDIGGSFAMTLPAGFGLAADYHFFMLAQKRGRLAGLGGDTVPTSGDVGNVGHELDVTVSWSPNDMLQLMAGYSIFLPSAVPEARGIGTDSAHWAFFSARARY